MDNSWQMEMFAHGLYFWPLSYIMTLYATGLSVEFRYLSSAFFYHVSLLGQGLFIDIFGWWEMAYARYGTQ